ncbi:MAG TPA: signal peptidase II, partial [Anaerolineales bacterium]|nr:signal peptidase II [Anaerolineales bacterium]
IAGFIIDLDQWTKSIVRSQLQFGQIWVPSDALEPYMRIVHWRNTGAAFGMFESFNNIFTILAILVSLAILYYFPRISKEETLLRLALSLQLGGAIGNLIDRLMLGHVTDFVSILNFPVFNVADLSISTGVVLLVWVMWRNEQQESAEPDKNQEITAETEVVSSNMPSEDA